MILNYKLYKAPTEENSLFQPPLIILHGLFGSSKNWVSIAKSLSTNDENYGGGTKKYQGRDVYALDQRNHGDSPHDSSHSLEDMVDDLKDFIQNHNLKDPIILGHSMGGLVTMLYALRMESKDLPSISKIIIQDIAPREYPFDYDNAVASMQLDLSECDSRNDVDAKMKSLVPDPFIRQFLQMNLERKSEGGYRWKLNVDVIAQSRKMFGDLFQGSNPCEIPALFLLGGDSNFIEDGDEPLMRSLFPASQIHTIPGGHHYIQYTHSEEFLEAVKDFL